MNMYARCGHFEEAEAIFKKYWPKENPPVEVFNAMIAACGDHGRGDQAIKLFKTLIQKKLQPTTVTFVNLLHACAHAGKAKEAVEYYEEIPKYNILVVLYAYVCCVCAIMCLYQSVYASCVVSVIEMDG